jgi:hypothetical protein
MSLRVAAASACVWAASLGVATAVAEELGPEQARAFVVGKLFAYTCFDGTAGMGRIFADGSVVGTIRPGGKGEMRFATLPAGTIKVEGSSMCAHLAGMPLEPCFRVQKIDYRSFRGSISGLGFAYCDFAQHNPRAQIIARAPEARTEPQTRVVSRLPESRTQFTSRVPAPVPVQSAPIAPVQKAPLESSPVEAQAEPKAPIQLTPPAQTTASVPAQAAPAQSTPAQAPAPSVPSATLRPAIDD